MQRISNNLCRMFPREFEYSFYKKVYCNSTAIIKDGLKTMNAVQNGKTLTFKLFKLPEVET